LLTSPNFLRPGVVGGFVLSPPQQTVGVAYIANQTWVYGGFPTVPALGSELIFQIGTAYSGMPLIVGSCFNWRGPWSTAGVATLANKSFAVGDITVWFDAFGALQTYLCIIAWAGGPTFVGTIPQSGITYFREIGFRGAWAPSTVYAMGDCVNALDANGNMQTWVATAGFTSGATFLTGPLPGVPAPQWTGALATNEIFFVVGTEAGGIQISTTSLGSPITLMTAGMFCAPGIASVISTTIATGVYGAGSGLVPSLSIGALFAQGTLWRPASAAAVPAAPANQFSYLAYNSTSGLYWTTNPAGTTAGDAVLGWVTTNSADLLAASDQNILVGGAATAAVGSGNVGVGVSQVGGSAIGGGGGSYGGMETMAPDVSWNYTPDGSLGLGHYTGVLTHVANIKPSKNTTGGSLVTVVIDQPASGAGFAVTWDVTYKGMSEFVVDTRLNSYTSVTFQVQADGSHRMLWSQTGVLLA
jgi:hypothetical protein